jgi:glutathione peroxidase
MTTVHDFQATGLDGAPIDLAQYRGKLLLIVNVASRCGFTPQYRQLQALHQRFQQRGLVVLGFPCNQFGRQEPGTADEIGNFCRSNYEVSFPLFAKIDVNGRQALPLFTYLKNQARGLFGSRFIKWNFTKFLVNKDGTVYKRYSPRTPPEKLIGDIETLLG